MKSVSISIVAVAVLALLMMQFSGLHLHASNLDDSAALHGSHVHDVESDGHDHTADVDVSIIDLGIVWSKIMPVLMAILPTALGIVWVLHTLLSAPTTPFPICRRTNRRPPLRAPPLSP